MNQPLKIYQEHNLVYSLDMMFEYISDFKPKVLEIDISELIYLLFGKFTFTYGSPQFSMIDVLKEPEKYPDHYNRIKHADLMYPIILGKNTGGLYIIDGFHRLTKAYQEKQKIIKYYLFPRKLLDRFCLFNTDKIEPYEWRFEIEHKYINILYKNRFSKN